MMSEEEIIKEIKEELKGAEYEGHKNSRVVLLIQGLLDLYNKEKEKLKITVAMLSKGSYPAQNEGDNDFDKQFISKDKIKDKIKELEKEYNKYTGYKGLEFSRTGLISSQIQVLKELLEEEK